ncbi:histidine phosphatase family protein [Isoptericola sp. b441]|uniref:Histidine phosphatase family protein n=1 Tax=Actinotalea lenta TaxID=3064654 RepID=A0ABT9DB68_9CELL|nr:MULTISPECIES: histidine phosphatase family protein [unclassified Isoptericola]MDO8108139.1 histidine phosphatase family protein [Isoptericola sp. b441]MDO8120191.1 histidine phosphatase family protein [Isoptericola sp. b490]
MTARAVVLWRHGRTAYNAEGRMQGGIDIPLDEVGTWQAVQGAQHLAQRHRPARIVASDLGRAMATAQALADLVGVPCETDVRLRERSFGDWEGRTANEIRERWPEEFAVWRSGGDPRRTGAETRAEVASRVAAAVEELATSMDPDTTLVVTSHGAAITLGIARLLGLDAGWRGIAGLHNAHWSLLRPSGRRPGAWYLESHNLGPAVAIDDWNSGVPGEVLPSSTADALRA